MGNWKENKTVAVVAGVVVVITLVLIIKGFMGNKVGAPVLTSEEAAQVAVEEAKLQKGGR